jgi:2-oxoisovalerate dehydrogenase E1 component
VVLTLGMTPYDVLLGVFARPDDPSSGGRQMPSHWGSKALNIVTGSSPIATHIPHAAGMALASKMAGDDAVAIAYFGDGAASKGDFHESLNFAGIHRVPMVLVCENNGYAISVPLAKESAVEHIAQHAHSYGFPGVIVDGNDPLDVYAATHAAITRARHGEGPTLIECKTYRYLAHTSDDDDRSYRTAQEVEAWRKKDPLQRMKQYVIEQRLLSEQDEEDLEAEIKAEIDDASRRAEAAAPATGDEAFTRVFARPLRPIPRVPAGLGDRPELRVVASPRPPVVGGGVEKNVIDTVRDTLHELMADDERVMVLGEDVGPRGGVFRATDGLFGEFGEPRVLDMPLAESSIVGVAIGLALAGRRPIAEIQFADFIHSAFDQLVSEAARIHYRSNGDFSVPMVVRTPWGGGVHGALYHSQAIEAFYAHVAGLKVVAPSTPADVAGMLREAVEDPDPVLFLEHKKTYRLVKGLVPEGDWRVPIGVADVVRPGDDLTVVTYGLHRHICAEAAASLAEEGISAEVIDLRTISPLDRDTVLASVTKTGRLLIVHEDNISFGVGAEVAAFVAEEAFYDLDCPIRRLAMPDVPAMPFAAPMEAAVTIGPEAVVAAIKDMAAH